MDSVGRRAYIARILVCTPLILLLLGFLFADVSEWLPLTVVIVTLIAIWFPYERVLANTAGKAGTAGTGPTGERRR